MKPSQEVVIRISSDTILRVILFGLLVAALFYLQGIILIVLTAVVIASAVEPAARWLRRYRIPRVPAVMIIYVIIISFFLGLFYFFMPPVINDLSGLVTSLPTYLRELGEAPALEGETVLGTPQLINHFSLQEIATELQQSLAKLSESFLQTAAAVFGGLLSLVLIIVLSFYLAVQETGVDDFLRIITPPKHQAYVIGLWKRSQEKIAKWMQGQLVLGLIVGILVYLGLMILQVPYALLLAILAMVFELIPIFGPILAAIPAIGIALVEGGATLAFWTGGLYLIIQQFENHLIYPLVVRKVVGVPALLVILALIIGAELAGFLGIILSVPIAAALQEFVADIQKERTMRSQEVA